MLMDVSIEANSVDPDQTAPTFDQDESKLFQQTIRADDLCCDWLE